MNKIYITIATLICLFTLLEGRATPKKSKGVAAGPDNDAQLKGAQIILECTSTGDDSRIQWVEYASGNEYGRQISDNENIMPGHPNADHYEILHEDSVSYDLLIADSVVEDGGTYRCMDAENPVEETAYAELIILNSDPVCVTTIADNGEVIEGHAYYINCSVDYKGNIAPVMTWTGPQPHAVDALTTAETVWSNVTFTAATSMDGYRFSCLTNFAEDDFLDLATYWATNTPTYVSNYEGPILDVYCLCNNDTSGSTTQGPSTTTGSTVTGSTTTEEPPEGSTTTTEEPPEGSTTTSEEPPEGSTKKKKVPTATLR